MAQKKEPEPGKQIVRDVVHQDKNWVSRINGELQSGKNWNKQWGYLVDESGSGEVKPSTFDSQIQVLQEKIRQLDKKKFQTTNSVYGTGQSIQMFEDHKHNMIKNPDLRPLQRKLPKAWKKQKWTPPADPNSDFNKKHK